MRNLDSLLRFTHANLDFQTTDASACQQFFSFGNVQAERVFVNRTKICCRQEILVNRILTFEEAVLHALIIHQILDGLAYFRFRQNRVFLVQGNIHQTAEQRAVNGDSVSARDNKMCSRRC